MQSSYVKGNEVTLQFHVRMNSDADIVFPAGNNLFRLGTGKAYPSKEQIVPALFKNSGIWCAYFVTVTADGYIRQNYGTSVTEILICGSYCL